MDHFERQLAHMMRDTEAPAPFEPKHRERLRAGVHARCRRRAAQRAVGSALAVVGLSVGLFLLPGHEPRFEPSHPGPRPTASLSSSTPPATPDASPSTPPSTAPASPNGTTETMPPPATGSTATATETSPGSTEDVSPSSTSAPPSGTATARNQLSTASP
ncbi:hypothetical protein [Streptomyces sp. NPDC001880]